MNIYLYVGLFLLIIAINKSKLKDIILLFCIVLLLIDFIYFIYEGNLLNISSTNRFSSIIGDRAFEGDFITGLMLFIVSCYLTEKYFGLKNTILISIIVLGTTYLLILKSRSGFTAILISLLIIFIFLFVLKIRYHKSVKSKDNKIIISDSKLKIISEEYYKKFTALVIIFIISILITVFSPLRHQSDRTDFGNSIFSIFDANFHSNKVRLIYWDASLKMFADYPVSGIGYGQWSGTFPKYCGELFNDYNVDINSSVYAHNDYIEIMAEMGFVGILYPIFIFYGIYRLLIKSKNNLGFIPFLAVAIGISITSFFNFTKNNFAIMSLFIVALGVSYSYYDNINGKYMKIINNYKKLISKFIIITALFLILFGIYFMLIRYYNQKQYLEAMSLKAQHNYSEMLEILNGISDFYYPADMNKIPLDYYRGVGYFELKQYDKALEKFRSARKRMKFYPTILNNEAAALYMTENFVEAENRFLEIKNIFPNYLEPQINLLSLYTNLKRYSEAKKMIQEIEGKTFDYKHVKNYSVFFNIKDYFDKNHISK